MENSTVTLDKIIALCKRKGFIYQSASIYGGLNGVYDFAHLGTLLKKNIRKEWLKSVQATFDDILEFEGGLLGPHAEWEASGHVENFSDPMVDCLNCKHRFRADEIDLKKPCPNCGQTKWTEIRQFNLMFKTQMGAIANDDKANIAYLRPETAQPIFVNFKNFMSTYRIKIPFGVAQMGKSFRNEITPKQFLFRTREFEQMEIEWFCKEETALKDFAIWIESRKKFYADLGLNMAKIRFYEQTEAERAHYSKACTDVEYEFPFGFKEIEGIAYRGNYDLTQHSKFSGKDLAVFDEETKQTYIPHVVECSVGIDRLLLTLLFDAYHEDVVEGETRIMLKLHPKMAPIKAAFFPLVKKLSEPMLAIYKDLKRKGYEVEFDESASIGKRYRRQDEIGTPLCFTYDFESETDKCVTVRNRDTTLQERISIDSIEDYIKKTLNK
ncbi:MAG: glycine--tRNA ligase [Candidatus Babeliales bacterium]|nr:glycine--tRNA ligase [Candidatus Babeliales bacterium]